MNSWRRHYASGMGNISLAIIGMAQQFAEIEKSREAERRKEQMLKPGGFSCHAWPCPLVRPYEVLRWQSDSRQQRRFRERKVRNA